MEVLYARCCGLDVHHATVVACVRRPGKGRRRTSEVRTFATTTPALLALADWLTAEGVRHVAATATPPSRSDVASAENDAHPVRGAVVGERDRRAVRERRARTRLRYPPRVTPRGFSTVIS